MGPSVRLMLVVLLAACGCPAPSPGPVAPVAGETDYAALGRDDVNRLAARLDLPLFWRWDDDGNGAVDPDEVVALRFYASEGRWTEGGAFTSAFTEAWQRILALAASSGPSADLPPEERDRRELVDRELDQGYPTLVFNDLRNLRPGEREFLAHMLEAGDRIDALYRVQVGAAAVGDRVPAEDPASVRLFTRNWGVRCIAPLTEGEPACNAVPGGADQPVDAYPAALQEDDGFCEALAARDDAETLLSPFTVVRTADGGGLAAVPLTEAYGFPMAGIAEELRAAAEAIEELAGEEALRTYLRAAADAFESNEWEPADEAWSRMNAENSAWYVRVGPDETYWEPCSRKAGFHLTLARINPGSLAWQERLVPVQQEMEDALAALIGEPYAARTVTFHLPDFIDIVTNHGDDRDPAGATIGQSLPNWGPVANEGRGRTVAMTNLYTDPDSLRLFRNRATALLDPATVVAYDDDREPSLLGTILHEAAHNLGPSHEYEVDGMTDNDVFGGPLATVMEEMKAQTGALWYVAFLLERGIITPEFARKAYAANITWCFGHISRGMYTDDGIPKPYSQLSAIQIGMLLDGGAMRWDPDAVAANGTDTGAFAIDFDALPAAVDEMMRTVGRIKATGDRAGAEELVRRFVDGDEVPRDVIRERVLRDPKSTFVYAVAY